LTIQEVNDANFSLKQLTGSQNLRGLHGYPKKSRDLYKKCGKIDFFFSYPQNHFKMILKQKKKTIANVFFF